MSTALHSQTARLTVDAVMEMLRTGALHEDDRVELLEGRLVPMSPKSVAHSGVTSLLHVLLAEHYGLVHVRMEQPIHMDDYSEPEPDISVCRLSLDELYRRDGHPRPNECILVAEVAYSSQNNDRKKAMLYGISGIPTYWMIDLSDDSITVHSNPGADGYRSVERRRFADGVVLPDGVTHLDLTRLLS